MEKIAFILVLVITYTSASILVSNDGSTRIINGNIATGNQFPYAASLQSIAEQQNLTTRGHRCGGVLITLQHILTSASCLHDKNTNGLLVPINPTSYQVFAGATSLANVSADRVRPVANFSIHPDFLSSPAFVNDIAIITLLVPFSAGVVTPIELPLPAHDPIDFTLCEVAGWGGTDENNTVSTELRFAEKYIYNQNLCTLLFNSNEGLPNILPTMVCATSFDIISTGCPRDVGNGLVCNNTLTGILFYDGSCQVTTRPELYTRVNNYTTWIRSISSAHIFSPGFFFLAFLPVLHYVTSKFSV